MPKFNLKKLYKKYIEGFPKGYIEDQAELDRESEIGARPLCACASGCEPFSQPAHARCRWRMLHSSDARVLGAKRPGLLSLTYKRAEEKV